MNDLLELAVEAHGALKRWNPLTTVKASLSITGSSGSSKLSPRRSRTYRNVAGVMVPTKRRVFAYDGEKRKIPEPLLVAIDIREIEFR
jgi:hypothetical protein